MLVFSAGADSSAQVRREVERAVASNIPILPLRIEDVVPSESFECYLAGQPWLDALKPPLDEPLAQLVTAVESLTQSTAEEAAQPGRPVEDELDAVGSGALGHGPSGPGDEPGQRRLLCACSTAARPIKHRCSPRRWRRTNRGLPRGSLQPAGLRVDRLPGHLRVPGQLLGHCGVACRGVGATPSLRRGAGVGQGGRSARYLRLLAVEADRSRAPRNPLRAHSVLRATPP